MRISSKALALSVILLAVPLVPPSFSAPAPIVEAKRLEAKVLGLLRARRFAEALPLAKRALEIREKALGAKHPSLVIFLNRLALIHTTQKNSKEARALQVRAMAMQKKRAAQRRAVQKKRAAQRRAVQKKLAARRRAVRSKTKEAGRLNKKAIRLYRTGRYKEAEPLFRRSLAIFEKALGPGHPHVATGLNNLAELYRTQGRYAAAEPLYKRSLAIVEKTLGPDHPRAARRLINLGALYQAQGHYKDAEPLYRRAIAIFEKLGKHKKTASIKRAMQKMLVSRRRAKRKRLATRRRAVRAKTGEARRLEAQVRSLIKARHFAKALPLAKRALKIQERALGADHTSLIRHLHRLAFLHSTQKNFDEANALRARKKEIQKRMYARGMATLAKKKEPNRLLAQARRYKEAERLYKRSLAIVEKTFGPGHSEVAQSLIKLATFYKARGRLKEAEPLYLRALAIHEKSPDDKDILVAGSLDFLGELYQAQGRHKDAEPLHRRSLAIWEEALSSNIRGMVGPLMAKTLDSTARAYQAQGKYGEAEPLYLRALAMNKRLGNLHPWVAKIRKNLAGLYRAQGRHKEAAAFSARADVRGEIKDNFYTSPNRSFRVRIPPLLQPGAKIKDKVSGDSVFAYFWDDLCRQFQVASWRGSLGRRSLDSWFDQSILLPLKARLGKFQILKREKINTKFGPTINLKLKVVKQAPCTIITSLGKRKPDALIEMYVIYKSGFIYQVIYITDFARSLQFAGRGYKDFKPFFESLETTPGKTAPRRQVIGKYMKEAMRLDAQARRLYGAKEYAMAVPLAKRALAIREKALGPEHPTVALSLNILGHFYFAQGRYKEAEPLHRKALAILEKKVGPNHADIVATLNSLASLNEKAGKRKEAAAFLERAEAMKKRLRGRK